MNIICEKKGCDNLLALELGDVTSAIYAHRAYAFARALSIQCECCGTAWKRTGFNFAALEPLPIYTTIFCSCRSNGWNLGMVAADHAFLKHKGRTIFCQGLRYVSCDKCRRGYNVSIVLSAEPGKPPAVTMIASD